MILVDRVAKFNKKRVLINSELNVYVIPELTKKG